MYDKFKQKVFKFIYEWSKRKIRDTHLKTHHLDLLCTNCNEWRSITGPSKVKQESYGYTTTCGNCNHESHWNSHIAPMPIKCDESGNPIQD